MTSFNKIKIDQLRLNIPYEQVNLVENIHNEMPKEVIVADKLLHLSCIFQETSESNGHNGYTTAYNFGSSVQGGTISVMWNETRLDMGILVDFTATGKALYEDLSKLHDVRVDWQKIIANLYLNYSGHLSRIDIATDLINYGFSVNQISEGLASKKLVFLNKQGNKVSSNRYKIIGSVDEAQTIYVGSRKSDAFLRIYNKKLEQQRSDALYRMQANHCNDWIRIEAEFKHRLAKDVGKLISSMNNENIYPRLLSCVLERWSLVKNEE